MTAVIKRLFPEGLKTIDVFILCSLAVFVFTRYSGLMATAYQNLYQSLLNPGSFASDIYLQNTYYMKSSVVFDLAEWTGISTDNDFIGFPLHVMFSLIALVFAFRIIRDFTPLKGLTNQLMALLALATIDHFLLIDTFPSVIYYGYNFTTGYGHALTFPLIYYTLQNRVFHVSFLSTLIIMISAKAGLFPIGACWTYLFLFKWKEHKFKLASVLVPLGAVLFMSGGLPLPDEYDLRMTMLQNAVDRSREENVLHMQAKRFLLLLGMSIPVFFFLLREKAVQAFVFPGSTDKAPLGDIKPFLYTVFVLSLLLMIGGGLYGYYFYKIYPDPRLIMLSTPRSLALYQWCFALLLVINVMRANLHLAFKAAFVAGMMYFDFKYNSYKPFELAILLWGFAGLGIFYAMLKQHKVAITDKIKLNIDIGNKPVLVIFALLVALNALLSFNVYSARFVSPNQMAQIPKWYSPIRHLPAVEDASISLRECNDIVLLGLIADVENGETIPHMYVNYLAIKSKYLGDIFSLVFNPEIYNLAKNRDAVVASALAEMKTDGKFSSRTVERFKADKVNILTHFSPDEFGYGATEIKDMGQGVWLIRYDGTPLNCGGK